jgi:hypothetical protein
MINSIDLIHNVLSFNIQKPERQKLLEDIKDFYKSKQILYHIYETKHHDTEDWIVNDLYRYYNNDIPTMHGFVNKFYDILSRRYMSKKLQLSIDKIDYQKNIKFQLNCFLGLLTPNERLDFILEKYSQ